MSQLERDGEVWEVIETTSTGVIAVLVVDGKTVRRRGYFPRALEGRLSLESTQNG